MRRMKKVMICRKWQNNKPLAITILVETLYVDTLCTIFGKIPDSQSFTTKKYWYAVHRFLKIPLLLGEAQE